MQLMTVALPQLEELAKKGGEEGRKTIARYTRWLTIALALIQATTMSIYMRDSGVFYDKSIWFLIYAIATFVAGTMFLMWLGEQITDKGIGNGVSLIIFVGIVLRYPTYVQQTVQLGQREGLNYLGLTLFLLVALITIVSIIFMYLGQRRIRVQQARRVVGRKLYAGRSTYIPLRLNNAGVISIIFAISLLYLPQQVFGWFLAARGAVHPDGWGQQAALFFQTYFGPSTFMYNLFYFLLVVVFTFFYSSVVVNTKDIAENLNKSNSSIPGIRPGRPTVDYLNRVLLRLTTVSALYLGCLAVLPTILQRGLAITTFYIGSTSLLIIVGVALDTMTQLEARLAMRDYKGFMR
jgi:preprotein translocase subunit SecY